jgi:hypothetical protein
VHGTCIESRRGDNGNRRDRNWSSTAAATAATVPDPPPHQPPIGAKALASIARLQAILLKDASAKDFQPARHDRKAHGRTGGAGLFYCFANN